MRDVVTIVGGGLAGCEAAWQVARGGVRVRLYEMRPRVPTAAHRTGDLAELVCSNSLKSDELSNAHGLLKEEMRRLGSLVLEKAEETRVPAGAALAVDREAFAAAITRAIASEPRIELMREELPAIPPEGPTIIATGPLVSSAMAASIAAFTGREYLYFFDAVSPIIEADSIDLSIAFRASRYDKGEGADYLNCPMNADEYKVFYDALLGAARVDFHDFDRTHFFEGCLPVEELALRGVDTLRFGPMKPVGLAHPRTGRRPYAVVQLRQDNLAADHYSMVGFQNQLKFGEQTRIFRLIPGLEKAVFVRLGMIHRNSYINAPAILRPTFQTRRRPDLFFAGQVSGVEGYVESAASGIIAGLGARRLVEGKEPVFPPPETALGALCRYISSADPASYQPTNIAFGLLPPLDEEGAVVATPAEGTHAARTDEGTLPLSAAAIVTPAAAGPGRPEGRPPEHVERGSGRPGPTERDAPPAIREERPQVKSGQRPGGRRIGKTERRAMMVTRARASLDAWLQREAAAPTWPLPARRAPLAGASLGGAPLAARFPASRGGDPGLRRNSLVSENSEDANRSAGSAPSAGTEASAHGGAHSTDEPASAGKMP